MKDSELQRLVEALRKGRGVQQALAGGGLLRIDRPLPFLCLYRRREGEDPATEALLHGQASYLVAAPEQEGVDALLEALARELARQFGAFLLLELWLSPEEAGGRSAQNRFCIHAPAAHPPHPVLEEMESALLAVTIHRKVPRVEIRYRSPVAAPGLPAPPPCADGEGTTTCLGLEIVPVYREAGGGETYVFAYEAFRRRLGVALKRTFHAFVHCCTRHRPAHYHELGPHRPPEAAFEVDRALARIGSRFDLLLHVTPVNGAAAWEEFRRHRFEKEAEFLYRPRTMDPGLLKRRLYAIPLERVEDPTLLHIFLAKRAELDRQITLLADRNTPRFLLGSRQLFGDVDEPLAVLADRLLQRIEPPAEGEERLLDAEALARHAREALARYRRQDPRLKARVEVREDVSGILVSHGNFLIGAEVRMPVRRLEAALAHEIGTHALTWHNGGLQPFREMQEGMAGYEPLQEGLAVLAEYLVGGLDPARLRQLAGRVKAVQLVTDGAGFVDTFRVLHRELGFGAHAAFLIAMRTFRGGGYTKDAIYLRGLQSLLELLASGGDPELLYLGKVAREWLPLVEELRWRRILHPPALLPHFFQTETCRARLQRLRRGLQVEALIEE